MSHPHGRPRTTSLTAGSVSKVHAPSHHGARTGHRMLRELDLGWLIALRTLDVSGWRGEQALCYALLMEALGWLARPIELERSHPHHHSLVAAEQAYVVNWIKGTFPCRLSFALVCEGLGINADALRRRVLQWVMHK